MKSAVLERVRKTITRYNMLPAGSRVAVAVSGGPDSVCLLMMLAELAAELGTSLRVAHFNHRLRGWASDQDENFVRDLAAELALPFERDSGNIASLEGNLEQEARRARNRFFTGLISRGLVDRVATGHTRDDQAETVLFRLMRGSGLTGIAGIHPVTDPGIVRPLLDITRKEVDEFLAARHITAREDESNRDLRFARNRIRHELMPQLQQEWNPQLGSSLAQLADLSFEEEQSWREQIEALLETKTSADGAAREFSAGEIAALPRALRRRLIRAVLAQVKGDLRRLEFAHVEQIVELVSGSAGEGRICVAGAEIIRSFDQVRIAPVLAEETAIQTIGLTVPGTFEAPDHSRVHLAIAERGCALDSAPENGATLEAVDLDLGQDLEDVVQTGHLKLRAWRSGDHYQPQGHSEDRKIRELFQRAKVPSWQREFWPIVTFKDSILWAKQFGPAVEYAAKRDSARVLRLWNTVEVRLVKKT